MEDNEILTVEELAQFLRMNERTVYKLAHEGKLPAVKIASQWRFKKSLINQWLDQQMGTLSNNDLIKVESGFKIAPLDYNSLFIKEHINLDLRAHDRTGVLWELVECLVESGKVKDPTALFKELQQREKLMSTGIEEGVAFPHPRNAKGELLDSPLVVMGRSKWGIDFGSLDGKPTRLFFLFGAPEDSQQLHLLARLNRMLKLTDLRNKLFTINTQEEALAELWASNEKLRINQSNTM